jgi:hypothetical protein
MTTIGKILVIVNFVFSIVTGALIVMVFTLSTNWERSYGKLKTFYEVSQANLKVTAQEANETKIRAESTVTAMKQKLDDKQNSLQIAEKKISQKDDDLAALKKEFDQTQISAQSATAELLRVKDELKLEQTKVKDREIKIVELAKTAKDQQDKAIQANIQARSYKERAESLAVALEKSSSDLEAIKLGKSAARQAQAERKPPPEDVEGIVKAANGATNLVTLSIGSDAGLSKGNSLYVYRLAPKPMFLGEVKVLDVNAHEAVGRPELARKGIALQPGDIVASHIGGQR